MSGVTANASTTQLVQLIDLTFMLYYSEKIRFTRFNIPKVVKSEKKIIV